MNPYGLNLKIIDSYIYVQDLLLRIIMESKYDSSEEENPFLKSIRWMIKKIVIAHQFIDSGDGLNCPAEKVSNTYPAIYLCFFWDVVQAFF